MQEQSNIIKNKNMLKMFVKICNTILTILGQTLGQKFNFLSLQKKMCLNES